MRRISIFSFALLLLAGCGGPKATAKSTAPAADSHSGGEISAPAFASPARWHYHPPAPDFATAFVRLDHGGCALLGDEGRRFLVGPAAKSDSKVNAAAANECKGNVQAANVVAPERLLGIYRRSPNAWVFAGESGTIYESASPLGAFLRTIPPPVPFLHIAGAGSLVIGAASDGSIFKYSEDTGWKALEKSPPVRVFDIAAAEGGRILALGLPESLYASADGGKTFIKSPLGSIGASHVGRMPDGTLGAQGLTESITWDDRRNPSFALGAEALRSEEVRVVAAEAAEPRAAAIAYGRAFIDGDRYFEAESISDGDGGFALIHGRLGAPHSKQRIPDSADCGSIKLGGQGKQLVTACVSAGDDMILARVRRSEDSGQSFGNALTLETLDTDSIDIAVSVNGDILITGVCRPGNAQTVCKPGAPLHLKPEGKGLVANTVEALGLEGAAFMPAFSPDGHSAYFLGRRGKDERLSLFVSHDGGESFSIRPLEAPSNRKTQESDTDSDSEERRSERNEDEDEEGGDFQTAEDSAISVGEDGTVGLSLLGPRGAVYMTADEDGRVLAVAKAPAEDALMAGFGKRVLAIAADRELDGPGKAETLRVWESLNGGASFDWIAGSRALDLDLYQAPPVIACGAGGCLLGDTVTRVGWSGQAESQPEALLSRNPQLKPAMHTPIVCELDPKSRWTLVENIFGTRAPDINEAMRGRSMWSVMTWDPKTGAVSTVSAELPASGDGAPKVITKTLFSKGPAPDAYAMDLSLQMEGYAAARVRYPADANGEPKLSAPMRNIEVSWDNYFLDGGPFHATIPDAGPIELGDIKTNRPLFFDTGLISVSLQGIFVRPHSPSARTALTYFLEPGGKTQRFGYPAYPVHGLGRPLTYRDDAAWVSGKLMAVGMTPYNENPFSAMILGYSNGDSWTMKATRTVPSVGNVSQLRSQIDWSYSQKTIGITSLFVDLFDTQAFASFQAFMPDATLGEPQVLPTPFDLPESPRPCKLSDRTATTRLEAPLSVGGMPAFGGTRHVVLVSEAKDSKEPSLLANGAPMVMLTRGVLMHGTKSDPCVAAWDTSRLGGDRTEVSAILSGDLEHSFVFREVSDEALEAAAKKTPAAKPNKANANPKELRANLLLSKRKELLTHIEYRTMRCQFDANATVPPNVWNASSMSRSSY